MYSRLLPGLSAFVSGAAPAWRMVGACRLTFSSGKKTPTGKGGKPRSSMKANTDLEEINLSKAGTKRVPRVADSTKGKITESAERNQNDHMSDLEQLKAKLLLLETPPPPVESPAKQPEAPEQQTEDFTEETKEHPEAQDEEGSVKEGTVTAKSEDGQEFELPPMSQQFKPGEVGHS